jgi:sulfur transfer complex TusBCD TusB component (DsrH family)
MSELDPETHELHDKVVAEEVALQEAVNAAAALHLRDVPTTVSALSEAIAARGLAHPTAEWLEAVAVELVHGNRYVVGVSAEHIGDDADDADDADGGEPRG